MKIRVRNHEVETETKITLITPTGEVCWSIRYSLGDATLAVAHGGPSVFPPSPLDALAIEIEDMVHDFATPDAAEHHGVDWRGHPIVWHTADPNSTHADVGRRPCASLRTTHTVREHIDWVLSHVVLPE